MDMMQNDTNVKKAQNILYFNSTKRYTLRLLEMLSDIKYYIPENEEDGYSYDRELPVPIKFGIYEKSVEMEDIDKEMLKQNNFQVLPRMILSFEGMSRNTERMTNKRNIITRSLDLSSLCKNIPKVKICGKEDITYVNKKFYNTNVNCGKVQLSYNSIPYNFTYKLLLQARGISQSTQIVESLLSRFTPSMNMRIFEFPLFDEETETQVLISDPTFDFSPAYDIQNVNIVNIEFTITVRGNIYQNVKVQGKLKEMGIFVGIWNLEDYKDSKLALYYNFYGIQEDNDKYYQKYLERRFNGTNEFYNKKREIYNYPKYLIKELSDYYPSDNFIHIEISKNGEKNE